MPKPPREILRRKPDRFRATPSRGIQGTNAIDREGGDYSAGIIRGMAIVSRGEALGHEHWIDAEFLRQTAAAIQGTPSGIKSRFTHPGLSADGMGKFLGRVKAGRIDGDVVRGDLHLAQAARETPDGDLAGYVLGLAEEDPTAFGTSIVFLRDIEAEEAFMTKHGAKLVEVNDGWGVREVWDLSEFKSPDPKNTRGLWHVRLHELLADDVVDDPAANPNGLFHRGQEMAAEADALLSYRLGLSKQSPALVALDVDPDRVSQFVHRFLDHHGLQIVPKGEGMSQDTATPTDPTDAPADLKPEEKPADQTPATPPAEDPPANPEATEQSADPRAEVRRYMNAFGPQGADWYADGLSFEAAKDKHLEQLAAENAQLRQRLAAVDRGEQEPAQFQNGEPDKKVAGRKTFANLGDNLAALAAYNAEHLPGAK